jgi:acetyl-CoA carboxylase biotin carboxylase subunit
MRVVGSAKDLSASLDAARREAKSAFGDDAVYLEKFVERPRHVEIQILADSHGTVLSLGERECSVQRRHQKMIEEAPSSAVSAKLRKKMGETAVRAARAAGYVNAGTCEFLLADNGEFYFLEMNTRLQVEHPVTELVTGIDLVQWQLRIAAGEKLPFRQEDIVPRGWAIECRITSEDASNGFLPSTGRIEHLHVPTGPGVRWDGGIEAGSDVGLYYDPMLAKLIVWGADREQAVTRMRRALVDLVIQGVETSRDFHIRMMDDEEFRRGDIDIQWLERRLSAILGRPSTPETVRVAAIAAALLAERDRSTRSVAMSTPRTGVSISEMDSWKRAARSEGMRE